MCEHLFVKVDRSARAGTLTALMMSLKKAKQTTVKYRGCTGGFKNSYSNMKMLYIRKKPFSNFSILEKSVMNNSAVHQGHRFAEPV